MASSSPPESETAEVMAFWPCVWHMLGKENFKHLRKRGSEARCPLCGTATLFKAQCLSVPWFADRWQEVPVHVQPKNWSPVMSHSLVLVCFRCDTWDRLDFNKVSHLRSSWLSLPAEEL